MANPGPGLLLLVTEEVTVSLLAPEEVTISLLAPEVAMDSLLAESPPEAAAVGPRGDQAVVGGGGSLEGPLCPVGFDLNLSISSDELFKQPCCLVSAVEPGRLTSDLPAPNDGTFLPLFLSHVIGTNDSISANEEDWRDLYLGWSGQPRSELERKGKGEKA